VAELTVKIDSKILKMSKKVKSVVLGLHSVVYRVQTDFTGLHPKKEFVRVSVRE
jgi:hypothetical protein